MALIFADGFDPDFNPTTSANYGGFWTSTGGVDLNTSVGNSRSGVLGSYRFVWATNAADELYSDIGGSRTTVTAGFAFAFSDRQMVIGSILRFQEGATVHVSIGFNASGYITVWRGDTTTVLATTNKRAVFGQNNLRWYYLEAEVTVNDTTGSVRLWLDGSLISTTTNIDTKNGGAGTITRMSMAFSASGQTLRTLTYFDDFYCIDSTGTVNNSRLGSIVSVTLRPIADQTVAWTRNTGTTNFSLVDDDIIDANSTYVSSSTAGQRDFYTLADLSGTFTTNIKAVEMTASAISDTNTADSVKLMLTPTTTTYLTPSIAVNTSSYSNARMFNIWELNPDTGLEWTKAEVNAISSIGIEK